MTPGAAGGLRTQTGASTPALCGCNRFRLIDAEAGERPAPSQASDAALRVGPPQPPEGEQPICCELSAPDLQRQTAQFQAQCDDKVSGVRPSKRVISEPSESTVPLSSCRGGQQYRQGWCARLPHLRVVAAGAHRLGAPGVLGSGVEELEEGPSKMGGSECPVYSRERHVHTER